MLAITTTSCLALTRPTSIPMGIDYPQRIFPTGRFCNGRLVLDIVASRLNFPLPRAYLSPRTRASALLQGVNYASAGCGILNETSNNSDSKWQIKLVVAEED
ncbi:hypothetical protein GOP47_0023843 [Adiantum capillus-veneris]|uniref:Uncharacterized protein n=1 Tax=Adiantum capillus-veneris TaxID=13818 RepID=A0A9D4U5G0_ADICA|nr:hypothetical protein GOP47_0023843 [Adiantum capillus-veneris]